MILLLTEEQAQKKAFKNVFKIIVSQQVRPFDKTCLTLSKGLIPSEQLFGAFAGGNINADKYYKEYVKDIKNTDSIMASFVALGLSYQQNRVLALVCSAEEMQYLYLGFLADYLERRYGIAYMGYKTYKKKFGRLDDIAGEMEDDNVQKLFKDAKKYKEYIFGEDVEMDTPKKKKKSKKKDKKEKRYCYDRMGRATRLKNDKEKKGKKKHKKKKVEDMSFKELMEARKKNAKETRKILAKKQKEKEVGIYDKHVFNKSRIGEKPAKKGKAFVEDKYGNRIRKARVYRVRRGK